MCVKENPAKEDALFFESALPDQSLFLPSGWSQQPVIRDVCLVAGTGEQLHALWQTAMETGMQIWLAEG